MKRGTMILLTMVLVGGVVLAFALFAPSAMFSILTGSGGVELRVSLDEVDGRPLLERRGDRYVYLVTTDEGETLELTPDDFSHRLYESASRGSWWARLFNISTPLGILWVTTGLAGQLLFSGRMIVQWIMSEKAKRSVVPAAFWWLSLIGSSMLLAYFIWRRDVVGVLGQGAGWLIYTRNLWLIYRGTPATTLRAETAAPASLANDPVAH